ncbi:hypothetical protein LWI29_004047 [Acer saccharum]|uniref:Serine hydroxymethyltransferase-like domain-containing protein n=1 Tax=Acer saccharum TaxID=4024 RepID=A0AA39RYD1_ACESA|nr:hypothetical protein LWI29_004047 [Acer saccharum]
MEEEKAAACYDELTRKGGGAARSMAVFSLKSLLFSLRVVWSSAVVVLEEKALDFRPNYARFRAVANKCGELFLCDMAHISGLVSAQFAKLPNLRPEVCDGEMCSTVKGARRPKVSDSQRCGDNSNDGDSSNNNSGVCDGQRRRSGDEALATVMMSAAAMISNDGLTTKTTSFRDSPFERSNGIMLYLALMRFSREDDEVMIDDEDEVIDFLLAVKIDDEDEVMK